MIHTMMALIGWLLLALAVAAPLAVKWARRDREEDDGGMVLIGVSAVIPLTLGLSILGAI